MMQLIKVSLVLLATISLGCRPGTPHESGPSSARPTAQLQKPDIERQRTSDEYKRIRNWIGDAPAANMHAWGMSYDHLFLNEKYDDAEHHERLRDLCTRFVRLPGGLDLLFAKLLDPTTSDNDIVAISQILVFWAMDEQAVDRSIRSQLANDVLMALHTARFDTIERLYPDLELRWWIELAAKKARGDSNSFSQN